MTDPVALSIEKEDFEKLREVLKAAQCPRVYFAGTDEAAVERMRVQAEECRGEHIALALSICHKYLAP